MFPLLSDASFEDISRQDLEKICSLLKNRTEMCFKRKTLRHHINHVASLIFRIKMGEQIKRGILKNKSYHESRLYLLGKKSEYRDICLQRSAYVRKTTKSLRQLLHKNNLRIQFDADNLVKALIWSNTKSSRTIISSKTIPYKEIERLAKDYEFHKVLFGE